MWQTIQLYVAPDVAAEPRESSIDNKQPVTEPTFLNRLKRISEAIERSCASSTMTTLERSINTKFEKPEKKPVVQQQWILHHLL